MKVKPINYEGKPVSMNLTTFMALVDSLPVGSRICSIDNGDFISIADDVRDPMFGYWCLEKYEGDIYVDLIEPADTYTREDVALSACQQWEDNTEDGKYYRIDDCGVAIFVPNDKENNGDKFILTFMVSAYNGFIVVDDCGITK